MWLRERLGGWNTWSSRRGALVCDVAVCAILGGGFEISSFFDCLITTYQPLRSWGHSWESFSCFQEFGWSRSFTTTYWGMACFHTASLTTKEVCSMSAVCSSPKELYPTHARVQVVIVLDVGTGTLGQQVKMRKLSRGLDGSYVDQYKGSVKEPSRISTSVRGLPVFK